MRRVATGPPGLPLLGHLPAFLSDRLGFLSASAARYGEIVKLKIGTTIYLLNDPEDVGHVLVHNARNYDKTPRLTSWRGRRLSGAGLLTSSGDQHLQLRRMLQPMFHPARSPCARVRSWTPHARCSTDGRTAWSAMWRRR